MAASSATLSYPSPETRVASSSNFSWERQAGAYGYWLSIKDDDGNRYGQRKIYSSQTGSVQISGLPAGKPLNVELITIYPAGNQTNWDSRTNYRLNSSAAGIQYPFETTLDGDTQWIVWDKVEGASYYYLNVSDNSGNTYFQKNMQQADRVQVTGLPTDGRDINIRLYTIIGNNWDRRTSKTFQSSGSDTTTTEIGTLTAGIDWSVPADLSGNGGLVDEQWNRVDGSSNPRPSYVNTTSYDLTWSEFESNLLETGNPFHSFERFLDGYADGRKVVVRLDTNSRCDLPASLDSEFRYYGGTSIVFWDANYQTELNRLVSQFGSRFANDPRVVGLHVGIGDGEYKSSVDNSNIADCNNPQSYRFGWGELNMEEQELKEAIDKGFSPSVLNSSVKSIVDIFVNAFPGNESKLMFMNYKDFVFDDPNKSDVRSDLIPPYNDALEVVAQYAFDRGLGNRDGLVENWMGYTEKKYGMTFTPAGDARNSCNMGMDENVADSIQGRYWGTENEEYGYYDWVEGRFGGFAEQPYRFMISSLRALQMRRNYVTISSVGMDDIDPSAYNTAGMLDYMARTVGRTRQDTPDAFVVHGERYVRQDAMGEYDGLPCFADRHARVREYGRWLTEIESGGWPSMPIDLKDNNYLFSMSWGLPELNGSTRYEYAARWNNRFTYDIDDVVVANRCETTCTAEVKVVFNDVTATTLIVENQQGVLSKVTTTGAGGIKTATFPVKAQFNNAQLGGDFTVRTENGADNFPIMLTRINFLNN